MKTENRLHLPDIVGRGYKTFWSFRGRYRVVKGSRASKKSKTTALWIIYMMMKYPEANALVIRKVFRTVKDSCFKELKWAIHTLGADGCWRITESPLEMTFTNRNGAQQKIYFRGLDDPMKVTSITVEYGSLCWMWIEEAYEVMSEADFDMLDESIRGEVPDGLFKQITLTFNPWNERHWLKSRFFDKEDPDVLAITTDYTCNEWLDDDDRRLFEAMKENNPRRYQVAGLGNWGVVEGLIFENWKEEAFTLEQMHDRYNVRAALGLDYGYTADPTALFVGFIDTAARKIFVWDELYKRGLSNRRICEEITEMGYAKERITADSAEPKSNDELRGMGLRVKPARKGRDSVNNGVQFIQDYELIIHPRCVNFLTEISNYMWDRDRFGNRMNVPADDFNHLMDAMRYALEDFISGGIRYNDSLMGGI